MHIGQGLTVCGGWRPGSSRPLKLSASSASALCQLSDSALYGN